MLALAMALALPAAAEAKGVVETVSATGQTTVPAGQTKSLTLRCPERAVALNGTATSALDATSSIAGVNARRWTFRFTADTNKAETASAVLRCVRLRLPEKVKGVGLAVETKIQPVFEIPAGETQTISMPCSHGNVPTGWGLRRTGTDNHLSITQATPGRHGWSFALENTGTTVAAGTLYARCLEKKQRAASGQRHTFSTRIASFTDQLEGSGTTSHSCNQGEYSLSTGVSLPAADDITLTHTLVRGQRDGEWSFAQSQGATPVQTNLVCLKRTTGFRR